MRQSVDKKDSISIESQIEYCQRKLSPEEDSQVKIFSDKGYSGKSINRPEFQNMMQNIRSGEISKIVVYKVDRISRSMFDFLNMKEEFNKYNIEFISCQEDFDTSTASGKMMMNLLMIFAEMERETIQKRITDNYYARGEKGLYMGGCAPFGYEKIETIINGKKTYMFQINQFEADILIKMFDDYANNGASMGSLSRELNDKKIISRRNASWSSTSVKQILHNPVYVKANADIYIFLKSKGANFNNTIEDFNGINGCYVYGKASSRNGTKFKRLDTDFVTIAPHKGIINSSTWLEVQIKIESRQGCSNWGTGSLSWLQGIVVCSSCGYSCYIKRYKQQDKEYRYFYCKGKREGICLASKKMIRSDKLEKIVECEIIKYLKLLENIKIQEKKELCPEMENLKIELIKVTEKIENLIAQIGNSSAISMRYINESVEKLDKEKSRIENNIYKLQIQENKKNNINNNIKEVIEKWQDYTIDIKKYIAKSLIADVKINSDSFDIIFN